MKNILFSLLFIVVNCLNAQSVSNQDESEKWVKAKYGDWGGPGVSSEPGPMDSILLKDYAPLSSLKIKETRISKAMYPVIDVHTHILARTSEEVSEWVKTMDEVGIEKSIILTRAIGKDFAELASLYLEPYPNRFVLYCGIDFTDIDNSDYSVRVVKELISCYKMGARGVGEITDKGIGINNDANDPLRSNDPRLFDFWEQCAELKMAVNIHIADHPSAWQPLGIYQERTPDYQHFNLSEKDIPSYDELINILELTVALHPKTRFVACHLANLGNDLERLSSLLNKYPNLYLDISARDYEIGRTPRASSGFITKYSNRIMFGSDMGNDIKMYRAWWQLLETDDEFITGRVWWPYYGLNLSPQVLRDIYQNTAKVILNLSSSPVKE